MGEKNYYLGLDMGTNSVGWAVTDPQYRILRAKGKDLWGIREFDAAKTAVERRTNRISRRRRQREQVRIGLLNSYFEDAIKEVDPYFLVRLQNSKYHLEDKDEVVRQKHGIFADEHYTDKEYFEQYPTIFHLRKELIYNTEPHDVRLVYLALLNMFKHRGHFLNASLGENDSDRDMKNLYLDLAEGLKELTEIALPIEVDGSQLESVLSDRGTSRSVKAEKLNELLLLETKQKKEKLIVKGICGLKIDGKALFEELGLEEKVDICFSDFGYEEKALEIQAALGEEYYAVIEAMKLIYDRGCLSSILKGYNYLSDSRVDSYEKHAVDLGELRRVIKKYGTPEDYEMMFRSDKSGSYSAYVNSYNSGKKLRRNMKNRKRDDLYATIKKMFKGFAETANEDVDVKNILDDIATETFLPKQLTASNGIIPNQVHAKEMRCILKNAQEYLPFLKEVDESGLTTAQRILKLFSFQIPYYIGPTTSNSARDNGNGWVIRKEEGPVLPWNIEKKIDMHKTQEQFIQRLVRECTYISGEKVLPKGSLMYERFCVLNEINNLRVNGERIDVALKQQIYTELFEKGKRITRKKLVSYLKNQGIIQEELQVSGIDIAINNSLSSYGKFHEIFGDKMKEDSYKEMCEEIIFWCTVYGDSRSYLRSQLQEKYGDRINADQIKRICGFKFKDWGRLSKEFLCLEGTYKETGEIMSLSRALWESSYNMMELINSDKYTFREALEAKQSAGLKSLSEFTAEDLDEYYFSAPVKRMVWQTLLIIKELERTLGCPPTRIFVEMTRSDEEKKGDAGRKKSRKTQLLELYKNIKGETRDWAKEIEEADSNGRLRSKKLYLYYTQMGRCMYTGKPIDLDRLFDDNLYDLDHIYPRHYTKDDNLSNNLVLVDKTANARKSDTYPIDANIRSNPEIIGLWKKLRKNNLITEEKYRRLTGHNPFSDDQLAGFIARQLVETSQGTKGVADLLKQLLQDQTTVVYAKASNVSDFRHKYDFVKSRLVNDFHHANDAYLNIVVGNAYYVKFTQNPWNYIKNEYKKDPEKYRYSVSKMFDWNIRRGDELAWKARSDEQGPATIDTVKKMMAKNSPLMTRLNFEGHGGIAEATLCGARTAKPGVYMPLKASDNKMSDVTKYGGFKSVSIAYFFLVEHDEKGKRVRSLETVPVYLAEQIQSDSKKLEAYCVKQLGLANPSIRVSKIKKQSLIKKDGYLLHISNKTTDQIGLRNAVNLALSPAYISYVAMLEKWREKGYICDNFIEYINNEYVRKKLKKITEELSLTIFKTDDINAIMKELNMKFYKEMLIKHTRTIFQKRPNSMGEKLEKGYEKFCGLSVELQCNTILQILNLTTIGAITADLQTIGMAKTVGVWRMNKKINMYKECILINQSVTGIYESKIDLLTI